MKWERLLMDNFPAFIISVLSFCLRILMYLVSCFPISHGSNHFNCRRTIFDDFAHRRNVAAERAVVSTWQIINFCLLEKQEIGSVDKICHIKTHSSILGSEANSERGRLSPRLVSLPLSTEHLSSWSLSSAWVDAGSWRLRNQVMRWFPNEVPDEIMKRSSKKLIWLNFDTRTMSTRRNTESLPSLF